MAFRAPKAGPMPPLHDLWIMQAPWPRPLRKELLRKLYYVCHTHTQAPLCTSCIAQMPGFLLCNGCIGPSRACSGVDM